MPPFSLSTCASAASHNGIRRPIGRTNLPSRTSSANSRTLDGTTEHFFRLFVRPAWLLRGVRACAAKSFTTLLLARVPASGGSRPGTGAALETGARFSFQLPGLIPSPFRRIAFSRSALWGGPPGPRGSPWSHSTPSVRILGYRKGRRGRRPRTRGSALPAQSATHFSDFQSQSQPAGFQPAVA